MFGRYNLPSDDILAAHWDSVVITASDEDPAYPLTNWGDRKPAKPSKLLDTSGWWEFDFLVPVNVAIVSAIYHNFDPGLDVVWKWGSAAGLASPAGSQALTIDPWMEDEWPYNPWEALGSTPTYRYWRLEVGLGSSPANSQNLVLGRPYLGGAIRDLTNDVRWGVEETEEWIHVETATQLGVEDIFELGGKRRRFAGEFALENSTAPTLISLHRSAKGRLKPWLLIPDAGVNDARFVRFDENRWSRTRETINHNIFPFRVQELSRGIPWP